MISGYRLFKNGHFVEFGAQYRMHPLPENEKSIDRPVRGAKVYPERVFT